MTPTQSKVVAALRALTEHHGRGVTGPELAARLGMKKSATMMHVRALRKAGIVAPAGHKWRSIRLTDTTPASDKGQWLQKLLQPSMTVSGQPVDVERYADVMLDLREHLADRGMDYRATLMTVALRIMEAA